MNDDRSGNLRWSLAFKMPDWATVFTGLAFVFANMVYVLSSDSEHAKIITHWSTVIWAGSIFQATLMVLFSASNTTRVPLLIWITLAAVAILFNGAVGW